MGISTLRFLSYEPILFFFSFTIYSFYFSHLTALAGMASKMFMRTDLQWNHCRQFSLRVIKWVKIPFKFAFTLSISGDLIFSILIQVSAWYPSPFSWKKNSFNISCAVFVVVDFLKLFFRFLYHFWKIVSFCGKFWSDIFFLSVL